MGLSVHLLCFSGGGEFKNAIPCERKRLNLWQHVIPGLWCRPNYNADADDDDNDTDDYDDDDDDADDDDYDDSNSSAVNRKSYMKSVFDLLRVGDKPALVEDDALTDDRKYWSGWSASVIY